MNRSLFALLATVLLLGALPARAETAASDPAAVRIADQVMNALGGKPRWDALPGLVWSFGNSVGDTVRVTRRHHWDMRTGRHRVEGTMRDGTKFVFVHVIGDSTGKAWMNGNAIEGDSLKKLIRRAQAIWTNDSYWFLMPYKLRDPGVTLKSDGEVTENGVTFDRIALSFENVGLTPGDRYWLFVNRKNHRIERWEYVLQGTQPPPVKWTWEGWEEHGGLWFPTAHRQDRTNVFTNDVEILRDTPAAMFESP